MEVIKHNKQITAGSVLVCINDSAFGVEIGEVIKVLETKGIDKVKFEKRYDCFRFLQGPVRYRFRKAYKNEEKKCKS